MKNISAWPEIVQEVFPDGDYAYIPSLGRELDDRGVDNIWLPYSPGTLSAIKDSGLIQWAVFSGTDLARVNETFDELVLDTVREGDMAAIVTTGLNPPESRQFWLLGNGD